MSRCRAGVLAELADAEIVTEIDASPGEPCVAVAVAPRRDGLLHIRHLDPQRYPEELIGVPDVRPRPPRGFWSDHVIAAARLLTLTSGYEVAVTWDPPSPDSSPPAGLSVAALLAFVDEATAADRRRCTALAIEATGYVRAPGRTTERLVAALLQSVCRDRVRD